jgi:hypothetical protein
MYATHMVDGRSIMVKGDGSEKESQVHPVVWGVPSWKETKVAMELGHSGPSESGG